VKLGGALEKEGTTRKRWVNDTNAARKTATTTSQKKGHERIIALQAGSGDAEKKKEGLSGQVGRYRVLGTYRRERG